MASYQAFRAGLSYDDGSTVAWRKAMKEAQSGMAEGEVWNDKQAFRAGLRYSRQQPDEQWHDQAKNNRELFLMGRAFENAKQENADLRLRDFEWDKKMRGEWTEG